MKDNINTEFRGTQTLNSESFGAPARGEGVNSSPKSVPIHVHLKKLVWNLLMDWFWMIWEALLALSMRVPDARSAQQTDMFYFFCAAQQFFMSAQPGVLTDISMLAHS